MYLFPPGACLVSQQSGYLRSYKADPFVKANRMSTTALENSTSYTISAWTLSFYGAFMRESTKLTICDGKGWLPEEMAVQTLKCYPLLHAKQEIRDRLKRRGEIFRDC